MSNYRIQQGGRELYITDGNLRQNSTPQEYRSPPNYSQSSPVRQQNVYQSASGMANVKTAVYANPEVDLDRSDGQRYVASSPTTYVKQVETSYPAPAPSGTASYPSPTYANVSQVKYSSPEPRYSPPPPPYSAVAQEREYQNLRDFSNNERRYAASQGPEGGGYTGHGQVVKSQETGAFSQQARVAKQATTYQERNDPETLVPMYTTPYPGASKYPEGAPSRIVYTTQGPPAGQQYVQSRPTNPNGGPAPPRQQVPRQTATSPARIVAPRASPPQSRPAGSPQQPGSPFRYNQSPGGPAVAGSTPVPTSPTRLTETRPYQLKPTLDMYKNERSPNARPIAGKEDEVDALTNLLMQNMDASAETDYFGYCEYCGHAVQGAQNACSAFNQIFHLRCFRCTACGMCANCGNPIVGQDTGCKALDQPFHIKCFVCVSCDICLKGQPFFAMDGKPYCEGCYMNTLEKCSVCSKPITERILRATGKPYHPKCFTCVVCGISLDGIPFTVDATNQIHCIEDFHKKFAPRCCVCGDAIMPEKGQEETIRIIAMDKSFHTKCYKCEDCGLLLSSESDGRGCYPLDDHILCKGCNAQRIQALTTKMTTEL